MPIHGVKWITDFIRGLAVRNQMLFRLLHGCHAIKLGIDCHGIGKRLVCCRYE